MVLHRILGVSNVIKETLNILDIYDIKSVTIHIRLLIPVFQGWTTNFCKLDCFHSSDRYSMTIGCVTQ